MQGGNPWVDAPITWAGGLDPVTSRVEEPWTTEPSVYGPFGTLLHGLSARVGGGSLRQGVWVWQLLVVLSWLAVRALLRAALDADLHGRVDVLWTLNPLVVGIGVLGAHIDTVAAALALAAVVVAALRPGWVGAALAGGLVALAGSTKFTYAVVGVAVVAAWWVVGHRSAALGRLVGALVGAFVVVAGGLQLWAGPHVYDQLLRSRSAVSLATPWRPLLEWGRDAWGNGPTRALISVAAMLLAVLLAWCLLRISRPAAPPVPTFPPDAGTFTFAPEPNPREGEACECPGGRPGSPPTPRPPRRPSRPSPCGSPPAWPWPTRSPRPTRCPGTTCSSGAPCPRCCPAWSTSWRWCGSSRSPSPTCPDGCSA